jgi:hypothetical protein
MHNVIQIAPCACRPTLSMRANYKILLSVHNRTMVEVNALPYETITSCTFFRGLEQDTAKITFEHAECGQNKDKCIQDKDCCEGLSCDDGACTFCVSCYSNFLSYAVMCMWQSFQMFSNFQVLVLHRLIRWQHTSACTLLQRNEENMHHQCQTAISHTNF